MAARIASCWVALGESGSILCRSAAIRFDMGVPIRFDLMESGVDPGRSRSIWVYRHKSGLGRSGSIDGVVMKGAADTKKNQNREAAVAVHKSLLEH